ncbi:hypothetical protein WF331_25645 [Pseudomonas sp. YNh]|uniref:hypothetical protein n=1 Tax=Pseudomonas TaxID=286 RepID=UPI0030F254EF
MQEDQKAQLTKATEGLRYLDLILTAQEADDLRKLVQELQAAGKYSTLDGVFRSMLEDTWSCDEPWPKISSPATPKGD